MLFLWYSLEQSFSVGILMMLFTALSLPFCKPHSQISSLALSKRRAHIEHHLWKVWLKRLDVSPGHNGEGKEIESASVAPFSCLSHELICSQNLLPTKRLARFPTDKSLTVPSWLLYRDNIYSFKGMWWIRKSRQPHPTFTNFRELRAGALILQYKIGFILYINNVRFVHACTSHVYIQFLKSLNNQNENQNTDTCTGIIWHLPLTLATGPILSKSLWTTIPDTS